MKPQSVFQAETEAKIVSIESHSRIGAHHGGRLPHSLEVHVAQPRAEEDVGVRLDLVPDVVAGRA